MLNINSGFVVLNQCPLEADEAAVFCVLGMPRGGTTMTAKLLQGAGVHMGKNLPVTAEDPEFMKILLDENPNPDQFLGLIAKRNHAHRKWGFKAPGIKRWKLLRSIPNCRFVVVFRDILAVANRNKITVDAELLPNMRANIALQSRIVEFLSTLDSPLLLLSYEKTLLMPEEIAPAILEFCGAKPDAARIAKLVQIVQPGDLEYLVAADPNSSKFAANLEVVKPNRIAGWIRAASGGKTEFQIEFNEEIVGRGMTGIYRRDLAAKFADDGLHGFDIGINRPENQSTPIIVTVRDSGSGAVIVRRLLSEASLPALNEGAQVKLPEAPQDAELQ